MIGVNSQIASSSRQSSGVGFAVPVDTVKEIVPQLIKGGEIERAYLGVSTTAAPSGDDGAVVAAIAAGGPAAGTRAAPGRPDHRRSATPRSRRRRTSRPPCWTTSPARRVELKVERGGQERTIVVQLGTRPDQLAAGMSAAPAPQSTRE